MTEGYQGIDVLGVPLTELAVYVSIGAAALLSVVIMCLQCKIIQLQRKLVKKDSGRSGHESSRQGLEEDEAINNPDRRDNGQQENSNIQMTNVTAVENDHNGRTIHNHTQAGVRISVASIMGEDEGGEEMEDDVIPGYDTVGHSNISSSRPRVDAYETISDINDTGQHVQGTGARRFQFKGSSKPQLGDYSTISEIEVHQHEQQEGSMMNGSETSSGLLPVYSTVNKPAKKRWKKGIGKEGYGGESQAGSATLPDVVTHHSQYNNSQLCNGGVRDDIELSTEVSCGSIHTYSVLDTKKTSSGLHDFGIFPEHNSSVSSIAAQQPLYSNCISLDTDDADPNIGDLSSREPAPPPIPARSDSVGLSIMTASVNIKEVQGNGITTENHLGSSEVVKADEITQAGLVPNRESAESFV